MVRNSPHWYDLWVGAVVFEFRPPEQRGDEYQPPKQAQVIKTGTDAFFLTSDVSASQAHEALDSAAFTCGANGYSAAIRTPASAILGSLG
jgi:hypothetical protein